MNRLLADPTRCRVFSEDVAVHWFPSREDGAPCYCGATTYTPEVETEINAAHAAPAGREEG